MVKGGEIRVYIEGDPKLREGFDHLLREHKERCQPHRISLKNIPCGSISTTWDVFCKDAQFYPHAIRILLVDADDRVQLPPRAYLRQRHGWDGPGTEDSCYHLMVQMMESYFLADPEALAAYYGKGFRANVLPQTRDVEQIAKPQIEEILKKATADCSKGGYMANKLRHSADLLKRIDPGKVRARARHCEQLFQALHQAIDRLCSRP